MNIKKHGVEYELENFDPKDGTQKIVFTEKLAPGEFNQGTTNEEVIDMMIDRFHALNKKRFSVENQCSILLLKNIRGLQKRRLSRKVEMLIEQSKADESTQDQHSNG